MESCKHINNLPDDLLVRILWLLPTKKLHVKPNAVWSDPAREFAVGVRKPETLVPTPPAFTDGAFSLQIAAVCQRWRRLAKHHVSTLLVREGLKLSLRDLSNAITCFPNLTHLHLCDGSVESLDDEFLTHLASSCPKLKTFHAGYWITADFDERKELHPISEAGLERFFQQSTQLEHLSLRCLHESVRLPASFFHLTNLQSLVLPDSSALDVPDFTNLTSLTALSITSPYLQHQQLSNLSQHVNLTSLSFFAEKDFTHSANSTPIAFDIAWLPGLKSLEFNEGPEVTGLRFDLTFDLCGRLERLVIVNCKQFERLPDSIGELLPSLQELSIRCTDLVELPDDFSALSCLESLTISGSKSFSSLSDNFGRLPALRALVLYELPILHLPDSFCKLVSLETLVLINCRTVCQLPADFCRLTAITKLVLKGLPLTTLPTDIGGLTNLETLFLYLTDNSSYGQQQFPASFMQLSSLKRLKLHHCMIGELPEDIGKLSRLQELTISDCAIRRLPEAITCLVDLQVLAIGRSEGISVPKRLDNCKKLKVLELPRFAIPFEPPEVLPSSLETLSLGHYKSWSRNLTLGGHVEFGEEISRNLLRLKHLNMALEEDAEEVPFRLRFSPDLHALDISNAKSLKGLPCLGLAVQQLRKLKLWSAESLTELPASITMLQHLMCLKIHEAKFISIPEAIGSLSRLQKLSFCNCAALEHLPSSLTQLSCLRKLVLRNTSIRLLPPNFERLTRLAVLDLAFCVHLQALPKDLTKLKMLSVLNVLHCSHLFDREKCLKTREVESMYGLYLDYASWVLI